MASQSFGDKRIDASSTRPSPSGGATGDNQARKQLFAKESTFSHGFFFSIEFLFFLVRTMMYGFGDDPNPYAESVALMEDLVVQYITDMVIESFLCHFYEKFSI